ncbi:type II toxin-antitoxin system PemK/MazF family toxin, partial [Mycobacterium tuberculosis]
MMRRGEIWQVDLDPARGSEANNQRPAVVVSNDRANPTANHLWLG